MQGPSSRESEGKDSSCKSSASGADCERAERAEGEVTSEVTSEDDKVGDCPFCNGRFRYAGDALSRHVTEECELAKMSGLKADHPLPEPQRGIASFVGGAGAAGGAGDVHMGSRATLGIPPISQFYPAGGLLQPPPIENRKATMGDGEIVPLAPHTPEYNDAVASLGTMTVYGPGGTSVKGESSAADWLGERLVGVWGVSNPGVRAIHSVYNDVVTRRSPDSALARRVMIHAPKSQESVREIVERGFNRTKHETREAQGHGNYFMRDVTVALGGPVYPDPDGGRYLFTAEVTPGVPALGRRGLRGAPRLNPEDPTSPLADSGVDSLLDPSMVVTFHDAAAAPMYLFRVMPPPLPFKGAMGSGRSGLNAPPYYRPGVGQCLPGADLLGAATYPSSAKDFVSSAGASPSASRRDTTSGTKHHDITSYIQESSDLAREESERDPSTYDEGAEAWSAVGASDDASDGASDGASNDASDGAGDGASDDVSVGEKMDLAEDTLNSLEDFPDSRKATVLAAVMRKMEDIVDDDEQGSECWIRANLIRCQAQRELKELRTSRFVPPECARGSESKAEELGDVGVADPESARGTAAGAE